jgi:hypothetical protein
VKDRNNLPYRYLKPHATVQSLAQVRTTRSDAALTDAWVAGRGEGREGAANGGRLKRPTQTHEKRLALLKVDYFGLLTPLLSLLSNTHSSRYLSSLSEYRG